MKTYKFANLVLGSNVPLPELVPSPSKKSDCSLRCGKNGCRFPSVRSWFQEWRGPRGDPWLSMARVGSGFLLRFPAFADFRVSAGGDRVRCMPRPKTPPSTVRHLFLDQVMPLVLSLRSSFALHAGAVKTAQGAVAFAGESGWGKSTLTASFCMHGASLLGDDCLALEERNGQVFAVPSYPGIRLWPETLTALVGSRPESLLRVAHYSEKRRLGPDSDRISWIAAPVPLAGIFFLTPPLRGGSKKVVLTPLAHGEGFMELLKYMYVLDFKDRSMLRKEFEFIARLVRTLPLYRVRYPRDLSSLRAVRRAILGVCDQSS